MASSFIFGFFGILRMLFLTQHFKNILLHFSIFIFYISLYISSESYFGIRLWSDFTYFSNGWLFFLLDSLLFSHWVSFVSNTKLSYSFWNLFGPLIYFLYFPTFNSYRFLMFWHPKEQVPVVLAVSTFIVSCFFVLQTSVFSFLLVHSFPNTSTPWFLPVLFHITLETECSRNTKILLGFCLVCPQYIDWLEDSNLFLSFSVHEHDIFSPFFRSFVVIYILQFSSLSLPVSF